MAGVDLAADPGPVRTEVPLVLAVASYGGEAVRERLLSSLAHTSVACGGRVLVVDYGPRNARQGQLVEQGFEEFPGRIYREARGFYYTHFADLSHPDIYAALESIGGAPARFDLLLMHVHGGSEEELFLASLAQRVVVVSSPAEANLQGVAALMQKLSLQHEQHHFTLVVDDNPEEARTFYRRLFEDFPGLLNVDCDLQDEVSASFLKHSSVSDHSQEVDEGHVLLDMFGQMTDSLRPQGSLKLFWKNVLFCSECSIKLCRKAFSHEQRLEVCPLQRF